MRLIELGQDTVAILEASDARSNGNDCACAIRSWYYGERGWERIFALSRPSVWSLNAARVSVYLGDEQVSIIEGGVMEVDKNVVVSKLGKLGFLVEFETVKPFFACYLPLLSCRGCHGGWDTEEGPVVRSRGNMLEGEGCQSRS